MVFFVSIRQVSFRQVLFTFHFSRLSGGSASIAESERPMDKVGANEVNLEQEHTTESDSEPVSLGVKFKDASLLVFWSSCMIIVNLFQNSIDSATVAMCARLLKPCPRPPDSPKSSAKKRKNSSKSSVKRRKNSSKSSAKRPPNTSKSSAKSGYCRHLLTILPLLHYCLW